MKLYDYAINYAGAGLSVIPARLSDKAPQFPSPRGWKEFQSRVPNDAELAYWFANDDGLGIALICGNVSGEIELIDIDNHFGDADAVYNEYRDLINNTDSDLFARLVVEKTQSGGYHLLYRCSNPSGNTKLAQRMNDKNRRETVIETRGEGGYALVAPSTGYELLQGDIANVQSISDEQRELLLDAAKSFNQAENKTVATGATVANGNDGRPGDEFNERGDVGSVLKANGWDLIYENGKQLWRRPGKSRGASATFNHIPNKFYVFSSNADPFEPDTAYDKFAVYTMLEHRGDFKSAAKSLVKLGYGKPKLNGNGKIAKTSSLGTIKSESLTANQPRYPELVTFDELNMRERFVRDWAGKIKYNHSRNRWLYWTGSHWGLDETDVVNEYAIESVRAALDDANSLGDGDARHKAVQAITKYYNFHKRQAMINDAASDPRIAVTEDKLDTDPYLFNLKNGTYNFKKRRFQEHNPDDLITNIAGYNYDPDAECPYWLKSLMVYFDNDVELITYIQKAIGLSLVGEIQHEKLMFLYGTGANGKTVFIRTLQMLCGTYWVQLPISSLLMGTNNSAINNDIARLKGKRCCTSEETPEMKRMNESKIKNLTSPDQITARFLYGENFDFVSSHSLWLYGNHKLKISGADYGIWRRIALIPFKNRIPDEMRRPHEEIIANLKAELSGILNFAIGGEHGAADEGFEMPDAVKNETLLYKESEDKLGGFIEDCIEITGAPFDKIRPQQVYAAYKVWVADNDNPNRQLNSRAFYSAMEERGFERRKELGNKNKSFIGIRIKSPNDDNTESVF